MTGARLASRAGERALLPCLALLLSVLSILPFGRLLAEGVAPRGVPSFDAITAALSRSSTWIATVHSLEVAIGGTVVAVLLGAAVALTVTLTDARLRSAFIFCFVLPLMIPPQVTALAWLQVMAPSSPLLGLLGFEPRLGQPNPLYSRQGIILILGLQYAPLVFLALRAGLRGLPGDLVEAARAAGGRPWTVLRTIILPLMAPHLVAATALSFVSCVGNFGIPAFLGIPANYLVLPTLIYQRLAGLGPTSLSEVSVLALVIGLIALSGILLQGIVTRGRDSRTMMMSVATRPFALGAWQRPVTWAMWLIVVVMLGLPVLGLLSTSLVPAYGVALSAASATLENYNFVLFGHAASRRAMVNSFLLAAAAAVIIIAISVVLAYFLVWRRTVLLSILNLAAELPYAVPGVVLAIASILVFLKPLPFFGVSLYNTVWIILFAYVARFLVLGLRPVVGGYSQLDRGLEEAAQVAGAGFFTRLRTIILPVISPSAVAGGFLVFMPAFNELTVSALLWSSGAETLGVVVFGFEQGGESTYASALALVTVVVTLALMLATLAAGRALPKGALPWRD